MPTLTKVTEGGELRDNAIAAGHPRGHDKNNEAPQMAHRRERMSTVDDALRAPKTDGAADSDACDVAQMKDTPPATSILTEQLATNLQATNQAAVPPATSVLTEHQATNRQATNQPAVSRYHNNTASNTASRLFHTRVHRIRLHTSRPIHP